MAFSSNIQEVGTEAFALLEGCRKPRPPLYATYYNYHNHNQHLLQLATPQVHYHTKETLDCDQAALKYGGVVISEHSVKKPAPVAPIPRYFY
ncbi:conserved hypothetical protein [Ricinus communis]|uniref:Uncharacterized protein n=1 Tax=Ricinus communis TaxID=3988 RepID=B9SAU7_RICCO|nr:conserved hypothetical protein [Ricinus communis]